MANFREPVAVLGLGRFGWAMARELIRLGNEVLAVDHRPEVVQRLSGELHDIVVADTTDADALLEIGIRGFDRVVVAIGTHLEASVLTTSLLSEMSIKQIWAKALGREHARILERVGAHHVILPEHEMGRRIAHLVSYQMLDYVQVGENWVVVKTKPPMYMLNEPLDNSRLRAKHAVAVVSARSEDEDVFRHVDRGEMLAATDEILVVGSAADVNRFVDTASKGRRSR